MTQQGDDTTHGLDLLLPLQLKLYFCWRAMDPLLDLDLPSFDRHFRFDGPKSGDIVYQRTAHWNQFLFASIKHPESRNAEPHPGLAVQSPDRGPWPAPERLK